MFPSEMVGKGCCISNKMEMIEGGVGEKERHFLRTEDLEGVRWQEEQLTTGMLLGGSGIG